MLAYFPIARKLKLYDVPNKRSSHKTITFRGGGILIPISIIFYVLFFGFEHGISKYFFISGVLLSAMVSFYDDLKGSNAFVRLICHFISVGLIMMDVVEGVPYNPLLIILVTIIAVAAVNAYNFMDGINAITGLYTLAFIESIFFYNYKIEHIFDNNFLAIITIALLIFGYYNFRTKAILFAGDVGSVSLGLICVFYILYLIEHNHNIIYLSMLAVYGVESGLTIFYRLIKGQNIFQAHRMHLFQDLVHSTKLPHLTVSFFYTLLQIIINIGMFLCLKKGCSGYIYLAYVIVVLVCIYVILKYQIFKRSAEINEEN